MQRAIQSENGLPLIWILEAGPTMQTTLVASGPMAVTKVSGLLMMAVYTQVHGRAESRLGTAYGHQLKMNQWSYKLTTNLLEYGVITMVHTAPGLPWVETNGLALMAQLPADGTLTQTVSLLEPGGALITFREELGLL